jgi:hypothetical protein
MLLPQLPYAETGTPSSQLLLDGISIDRRKTLQLLIVRVLNQVTMARINRISIEIDAAFGSQFQRRRPPSTSAPYELRLNQELKWADR